MGKGWGEASDLPKASASATEASPAPARTEAMLLVMAIFPELPFRWIPSAFTLSGSPYLDRRSPPSQARLWRPITILDFMYSNLKF